MREERGKGWLGKEESKKRREPGKGKVSWGRNGGGGQWHQNGITKLLEIS